MFKMVFIVALLLSINAKGQTTGDCVTVSWITATAREDGTELNADEIKGHSIYIAQDANSETVELTRNSSGEILVSSYVACGLEHGTHNFSVATLLFNGSLSAFTTPKSILINLLQAPTGGSIE